MSDDAKHRPPPLQFGIGALLVLVAVVAAVFGVLRWLGVSAKGSGLVLLILLMGAAAAFALLWTISRGSGHE